MGVLRSHGFAAQQGIDYRHSPHLAHWPLHDLLSEFVLDSIRQLQDDGLPLRVLEVGAGHGGLEELLLAAGCEVTVVEMSPGALHRVEARHGRDHRLIALLDPQVGLDAVPGPFSFVLCVSVLHHIPDYLALLQRIADRLLPGGTLVTLQDPLWYPRVGRPARAFDRSTYVLWRVGQGQLQRGVQAMVRRFRRVYPEAMSGEVVYHHVVRLGVDEEAVASCLADGFGLVEVVSYWSHHLAATRVVADATRMTNTFAVRATGRAAH